MVLASSKFFTYPLIFGSKTHNCVTSLLYLKPTKYSRPYFCASVLLRNSEINNTQVDYAKDLDGVIARYTLIEYSK